MLEVKNLHVSVGGRKILDGLNLTVKDGEVAAIMGPNGTGKSTLSYVVAGREDYEVEEGEVLLDGVANFVCDHNCRGQMIELEPGHADHRNRQEGKGSVEAAQVCRRHAFSLEWRVTPLDEGAGAAGKEYERRLL